MTKFMAMLLTAFLARTQPVSNKAKPTCMNITRNPPIKSQARLSDCSFGDGMSPLPLRRRSAARYRRMTTAEPDQRRQPGENGDDHQRHGQAARYAATATAVRLAGLGITRHHPGRIAQIF